MPKGKSAGKSERAGGSLAMQCAAIPGKMRAVRSLAVARDALEQMVALASAEDGVIVERRGRAHAHRSRAAGGSGGGDVLANLWFVRAAHEFAVAAKAAAGAPSANGEPADHLTFASSVLLPMCKHIVQAFISGNGLQGVRMDDSGMLAAAADAGAELREALPSPLRLNALWYAALETTGQALRRAHAMGASLSVKDPVGDHFERLAGRFRRAFSKAYWCDDHGRVCAPDAREQPDHCPLPDAEQLLFTMLPASPLPRTKQREVLQQIEAKALSPFGVLVFHPDHGIVESPIHRAWMAQGTAGAADNGADLDHALTIARALVPLWESARGPGLHPFYKDGHALGKIDPFVTAEVLGTLERFIQAPI